MADRVFAGPERIASGERPSPQVAGEVQVDPLTELDNGRRVGRLAHAEVLVAGAADEPDDSLSRRCLGPVRVQGERGTVLVDCVVREVTSLAEDGRAAKVDGGLRELGREHEREVVRRACATLVEVAAEVHDLMAVSEDRGA